MQTRYGGCRSCRVCAAARCTAPRTTRCPRTPSSRPGIAEGLDVGILDVDSDPCRYDHTLAVHEDVEMRVDVMRESLLALRLQPRGNGEAQRVFGGSPGSRAVRRLRCGVDHGRCDRGLEQQAGQDGDAQDENARGAASGGFADRADPSVIPAGRRFSCHPPGSRARASTSHPTCAERFNRARA